MANFIQPQNPIIVVQFPDNASVINSPSGVIPTGLAVQSTVDTGDLVNPTVLLVAGIQFSNPA